MTNLKVAVFAKKSELAEALQEKFSSKHSLRRASAHEYQARLGLIKTAHGKTHSLPIFFSVPMRESVFWQTLMCSASCKNSLC
jgi:hypothetical protein